jgi:hypothetical protein
LQKISKDGNNGEFFTFYGMVGFKFALHLKLSRYAGVAAIRAFGPVLSDDTHRLGVFVNLPPFIIYDNGIKLGLFQVFLKDSKFRKIQDLGCWFKYE